MLKSGLATLLLMRTFALAFALLPALPAQAPPVLLHATLAGPAEWRSRLGPTNLGNMLASAPAEEIWRGYVDRVDAALRSARGEEEAFGRERARLLAYAGEIHLVAWLEQAEDALHVPRWSLALFATPDGRTDLAAMSQECRGWLARAGAKASNPWRDLRLLPPHLDGERMIAVLACAEDLDRAAARARGFALTPLPRRAVLRCELGVPAALGLLRDRAPDRDFFTALLGPGLRQAALEIGGDGPRVAVELALSFGAGDRGLAAGLWPARPDVPDLGWLVPEGTATHYAWRVDLPALWRTWLGAQAAAQEIDVARSAERARATYGCDLEKTVLSRLGDEAMLLWSSSAPDADPAMLANASLVVTVREQEELIAAIEALAARIGLAPGRSADGVLRAEFPPLVVTIGHGVACVGFDRAEAGMTEAVMERAARGPGPAAPAADPGPAAPAGHNGRGRLDVTTMVVRDLYGQLRWLLLVLGELRSLPRVVQVAREAGRWLPLLQEHELACADTFGGSTDGAWRLRILW